MWDEIKEFVYNTLGHALSGGLVGIVYEIEQLVQAGSSINSETVLLAITLGGSIGFVRAVLNALENAKKTTAVRKKTMRAYLGL